MAFKNKKDKLKEAVRTLILGRRQNKKSFLSTSMRIAIPFLIFLLLVTSVMVWGILQTRELAYHYIEDTAGLYMEQLNRDIQQINADLIMTLRQSENALKLPDKIEPQDSEYYKLLKNISEQNRVLKIRYKEAAYIYTYQKEADLLILNSGTYFRTSKKEGLIAEMVNCLKENGKEPSDRMNWTILETDGEYYIFSWYFYKKTAMGCVMQVEDILEELRQIDLNYEVIPYLTRFDGELLLGDNEEEIQRMQELSEKVGQGSLWSSHRWCSFQLGAVGRVQMYIRADGGILEKTIKIQLLLTGLGACLVLFGVASVYLYYKDILRPMRQFVDGLKNMKEEQTINQDETNHILELEMASKEFKELLRKIQNLKITIYEEELLKQQAELEYTQEQIKPHFFLNCLSIIHGIADEDHENRIVRITEKLSDYVRYIFKDSGQERQVKEEIAHVQDYIEIQKIRYGEEAFSFEIICDGEEIDELYVPSLLLQTLVENAVMHGVTLDSHVDITLYMVIEDFEDGQYLYLTLSDTGKGFRDDILEALEQDRSIYYNGRKHVGLQNIARRLSLLYGDKGSVNFYNMDKDYGAVVEVRMPAVYKVGKITIDKSKRSI